MLVLFLRSGGRATASRTGLCRSGVPERFTRLYSKISVALHDALLGLRAIARSTALVLLPSTTQAGAVGLAFACTSSRHHTPGAQ